jgi:hypothetical protein
VPVDQRVPELPLRACDPKPVPLEGAVPCPLGAELLTLGDELRDAQREHLDGGATPAPPEADRAQTSS